MRTIITALTRTKRPATMPLRKRNTASMRASLSLRKAKNTSSTRNGRESAIANGQPRMPPRANQNMPWVVFNPFLQFMNAAIPSMVQYIAKLEGRNAEDAWNMPGEKTFAIKKNNAMRGFNILFIARNKTVWHIAHPNARA